MHFEAANLFSMHTISIFGVEMKTIYVCFYLDWNWNSARSAHTIQLQIVSYNDLFLFVVENLYLFIKTAMLEVISNCHES